MEYDGPEYEQFIELLADIIWESMQREAREAHEAMSDPHSTDTGGPSDSARDENTQAERQPGRRHGARIEQPTHLLLDLKRANWVTALRTYGNDHSTLIGLLVDWWITGGPRRWALEGGPSIGMTREGHRDRRACDAILGEGDESLGILEVEGSRHIETIEKLEGYFASQEPDLTTIRFGLFLGYHTIAKGRGTARQVEPLPKQTWIQLAQEITTRWPKREIFLLGIEKEWQRERTGPRARSEYYQCHPVRVWGLAVRDGVSSAPLDLAVAAHQP